MQPLQSSRSVLDVPDGTLSRAVGPPSAVCWKDTPQINRPMSRVHHRAGSGQGGLGVWVHVLRMMCGAKRLFLTAAAASAAEIRLQTQPSTGNVETTPDGSPRTRFPLQIARVIRFSRQRDVSMCFDDHKPVQRELGFRRVSPIGWDGSEAGAGEKSMELGVSIINSALEDWPRIELCCHRGAFAIVIHEACPERARSG